jgi:hypothetical protein
MPSWTEKELEDCLCEDGRLWSFLNDACLCDDGDGIAAWRQVKTPAGILDILVACKGYFLVIELKAVTGDGQALSQVLAYSEYIKRATYRCFRSREKPRVRPVLIAPSFDDRTLAACEFLDIEIRSIGYSFDFDWVCLPGWCYEPETDGVGLPTPVAEACAKVLSFLSEEDGSNSGTTDGTEENEQVGETTREDQ